MRSFAFFDLDHTLLPFDTQLLFCNFVLRRERWRTLLHLTFAPVALLKACRLVRTVTAKRAFQNFLAGMNRRKLQVYAKEFAEQSRLVESERLVPVSARQLDRTKPPDCGRVLADLPRFQSGEK